MIYHGLLLPGRIFADYERDGAVRIHVVGAILRIVFDHKNCGIVPIRAMRNGVYDSPEREIIVGDGRLGRRLAGRVPPVWSSGR
jgi:hypothetical protein